MKKLLAVLAVMGLISSNVYAADFAYVDLMKLFNDYKKTVSFDEELAKKQTEKEKVLQEKNDKIVKMQDELALLKDAAKTAKEKEISTLAQELQTQYQADLEALKTERDEKMKVVLVDIEKVIADYAKQNGYAYIFKKAALAYADEKDDKTAEVLAILNK